MSLTRKVTLILILVFLLSGLLSLGIQQMVIMPSFLALEEETATKNAGRALEAMRRELDQISPSVSDWAYWDDTYNYAKGKNPDYVEQNLDTGSTLEGLNMSFMAIYDAFGKPIWSQALDLETQEQLDLGVLTGNGLSAEHPLLQHPDLTGEVKGILATGRAPLMIVAKPILTNDREGPAAGTFLLGRFLDTAAFERLAEQTKLALTVSPGGPSAAAWVGDARQGLAHSAITLGEQPDRWQASTTVADLFGQPLLALRVDTPRDISMRGTAAVQAALWSLAATGLLTMLVMWLLLRHTLLRPISELTEHAVRIGADDNLHAHLGLGRQDEVGVLAGTFDEMVDRLAEARRRLVDQSFRSGVAEMASGVLHNIGNAVTPLNVRLSTLNRDLRAAPVAEMEQAAAELTEPVTPPERRADLVQFVELAGVELAGLVKRSRDEVAAAAQQIVHLQEILADQERFSRSARVIEPVDMETVIRDAISGLSAAMKAAMRIEVTASVTETGAVAGARAALQQVVTNLLVNAEESIQSAGSNAGQITITAAPEEVHGQLMAHLRFADNGAGIQADHIGRLFERGFSTKGREGSGHGLHWSANTVQALGGRISAESAGSGQGACLHVLLPLAQTVVQQATGTAG